MPRLKNGAYPLKESMAALTTAEEYAAVREAIQQLTTLNTDGTRRDIVSFNVGDVQVTYGGGQLTWLQDREIELAKRLTVKNSRKRVTPDFANGCGSDLVNL